MSVQVYRERYSPAFGGAVERLPEGWVCGRDCDIGGEPGRPVRMDLVLMHPALGIALIDREGPTEGAEDILRERLEEARFGAIFGGHLPVLHCAIQSDELPSLAGIERAFGEMEPLSLAGGDAWLPAVARVAMPIDRRWADNLEWAPNKAKEAPRGGLASTDGRPYGRAAEVVPLRRVASVGVPGTAAAEAEKAPTVVRPWTQWAANAAALPWKRIGAAVAAGAGILGAGVLVVGRTGSNPTAEVQTAIPAQVAMLPTEPEAPTAPSVMPILAPPASAPPVAAAPRLPAATPRHSARPHQAQPAKARAAAPRKPGRPPQTATRPNGRT